MDASTSNVNDGQTLRPGYGNSQSNSQYQAYPQVWVNSGPPESVAYDTAAFPTYPAGHDSNTLSSGSWPQYAPQEASNFGGLAYYSAQDVLGSEQIRYDMNFDSSNAFGPAFSSGNQGSAFVGYPSENGQGQTISPYELQNAPAALPPTRAAKASVPQTNKSTPTGSPKQSTPTTDPNAKLGELPTRESLDATFIFRDVKGVIAEKNFSTLKSAPFAILGCSDIEVEARNAVIPGWKKRVSAKEIRNQFPKKGETGNSEIGRDSKRLKMSHEDRPSTVKAPAKKRGRPSKRKDSVTTVSSSNEQSSSDEDSDEMKSPEEVKFEDVFSEPRSADPAEAIKHDTARALWRTRLRIPTKKEIEESVKAFGNLMSGFRLDIQELQKDLAKARDKELPTVPDIKGKLDALRKNIDIMVSTALKFGHSEVLQNIGMANLLLLGLREHVVARITELPFNAVSVKSTLELLAIPHNIGEEKLTNIKWPKLAQKLRKRGDAEMNQYLDKIEANAKIPIGGPVAKPRRPSLDESRPKKPEELVAPRKVSADKGGIKRPRERDESRELPAKKPALDKAAASTSLKKTQENQGSVKNAGSSVQAPKVKAAAPLKPLSLFQGLQNAGKSTKLENKNTTAKPTVGGAKAPIRPGQPGPKGEENKTTTPPEPKAPAFSFSAAMASISKAKETNNSPSPVPQGPPETEEEKKQRLRKEARRKLRVKFKDDAHLVDVRYFTHEVGEEVSAGDQAARDVRNAASEGQALKRHLAAEDEEDDSVELVETFMPWRPLIPFPLDGLPESERVRTYVKFGGYEEPVSPETVKQKEREATTLMAVYTRASDIPDTPMSPPPSHVAELVHVDTIPFGEPNDRTRQREAEWRARNQNSGTSTTPSLTAILSTLAQYNTNNNVQQYTQPQPAPAASLDYLKNLVAQLSNPNQSVQPAPPQPVIPPPQPVAPAFDQSALQNLLSKLGTSQPNPAPQQNQQPQPAWNQYMQNQNPYGAQQNQAEPQNNQNYQDQGQNGSNYGQGKHNGNNNHQGGGYSGRSNKYNEDRKFTVICRFYQEGKCIKGNKCTYRHE